MDTNRTRRSAVAGLLGLLLIGAGCGDDSRPATPEILYSDSFEEDGFPTEFDWRPRTPDFPAKIIQAECPDGGSWALKLTANDPVYLSPRVQAFRDVPEIRDGDILEFSAWVQSSRRSARAYISFCYVDYDVIGCFRTDEGTSTSPEWTRVSVILPVRLRPMDSIQISLNVSTESPGVAPVLFDRVELKRIGNSHFLDRAP